MGQFLLPKESILTRYLKVSTFSKTWSCYQNSFSSATWEAVLYRWWGFRYSSLLHIVVTRCLSVIEYRGINMSHWLHQGWVAGPLLMNTMVSSYCQFMKCSRRLVRLSDLSGQPLTGQLMDVAIYGKATRYHFGVRIFNVCGSFLTFPYRPCCIWMWEAMYSTANYSPHSPHTTIRRCFTQ